MADIYGQAGLLQREKMADGVRPGVLPGCPYHPGAPAGRTKAVNHQKIGYTRVSTTGQKLERQLDMLRQQGAEILFQEKMTGTKRVMAF